MASLLRQIVAGPRARHPEAGLDLCYVTDTIIATSGPSGTFPQIAYRNPLKELVSFLDSKHADDWAIWEFRAEGTGYPDEEVYGRVRHYPWPDHHPPPFALIPLIVGSMRNWLHEKDGRVVVVHCKAGKGRSGTVSCSYLIAEEGWDVEDAKQRFTERRMRPGFGSGISIPSQIRTLGYVDRWTKGGKKYIERPAEVLEVHVWGLRDGVKLAVEGFAEEGKLIKTFHTFNGKEREVVKGDISKVAGFGDVVSDVMGRGKNTVAQKKDETPGPDVEDLLEKEQKNVSRTSTNTLDGTTGGDVVFRPTSRIVLPSSDINIDVERRNKTKLGGFTMVTAVAHVWFNIFFEGQGPEKGGHPDESGVFEIDWDAMDGVKGSSRKGTRAFDRIAVVWKVAEVEGAPGIEINEPAEGEPAKEMKPADWHGVENAGDDSDKKLGLRAEKAGSAVISRASSVRSGANGKVSSEDTEGTRPYGQHGEEDPGKSEVALANELSTKNTPLAPSPLGVDASKQGIPEVDGAGSNIGHVSTADLPNGVPEEQLDDHDGKALGGLKMHSNKQFEKTT
jgi:protein-tyrosine phosphatase